MFGLGLGRIVEMSGNVFNVFNAGNYTEYARTGPNRIYNPGNYLTYTNPQTPRAAPARSDGSVLNGSRQ